MALIHLSEFNNYLKALCFRDEPGGESSIWMYYLLDLGTNPVPSIPYAGGIDQGKAHWRVAHTAL